MAPTNVPALKFTPTGLVLPLESEILAGVLSDIDAAFGGGVNPALNTPQGQLASSQAAVIGHKNDEIAALVNQVDPAFAAGRMQDGIARIYFIDRKPATSTTVEATCMGLVGTVIPAGAQAVATDGTIYTCMQTGTISSSGSIDLTFSAATPGPIALPSGALNQIYRAIPGWDRVENLGAGAIGALVESRADFEYRRRQSVALNGAGSLPSIYANVFSVDDVLDVYVTENTTSAPISRGGVTLVGHSIYVAAVGGSADDIARAIWHHKPPGADYNGNTSVTVTDESGYSAPKPSYVVRFQRPVATPVLFSVEIDNDPSLPSNVIELIKQAIVNAFNGADGGVRARIGATIYAGRFYSPVSAAHPSISILSLLLGAVAPTSPSLLLPIDERPTISADDISVTLA